GGSAEAEAADLAGAVEIEWRIEFQFGHQPHADAAGNAALRFAAFPDAATMLVDQLADRDAERQLHTAWFVDVAADAIQFRPIAAGVAWILRVGGNADRLEPVGAAIDDVSDASEGLDVVDDGRLAKGAFDGGERRLDARP